MCGISVFVCVLFGACGLVFGGPGESGVSSELKDGHGDEALGLFMNFVNAVSNDPAPSQTVAQPRIIRSRKEFEWKVASDVGASNQSTQHSAGQSKQFSSGKQLTVAQSRNKRTRYILPKEFRQDATFGERSILSNVKTARDVLYVMPIRPYPIAMGNPNTRTHGTTFSFDVNPRAHGCPPTDVIPKHFRQDATFGGRSILSNGVKKGKGLWVAPTSNKSTQHSAGQSKQFSSGKQLQVEVFVVVVRNPQKANMNLDIHGPQICTLQLSYSQPPVQYLYNKQLAIGFQKITGNDGEMTCGGIGQDVRGDVIFPQVEIPSLGKLCFPKRFKLQTKYNNQIDGKEVWTKGLMLVHDDKESYSVYIRHTNAQPSIDMHHSALVFMVQKNRTIKRVDLPLADMLMETANGFQIDTSAELTEYYHDLRPSTRTIVVPDFNVEQTSILGPGYCGALVAVNYRSDTSNFSVKFERGRLKVVDGNFRSMSTCLTLTLDPPNRV